MGSVYSSNLELVSRWISFAGAAAPKEEVNWLRDHYAERTEYAHRVL